MQNGAEFEVLSPCGPKLDRLQEVFGCGLPLGLNGPMSSEPSIYMTPRLAHWRARTDTPLLVMAIGSVPLLLLELSVQNWALAISDFST
jgi:hypothetical protein